MYIEKGPTVLKYILGNCDWVSDTESGCHNLFPTERKLHFYCYLQTLTFATCLIYYLCQITTFNCFPIHICKAQDGKVVGLNLIRLFHGKRKFKSWELILRIYSKTKIKPSRNHDSLKQIKTRRHRALKIHLYLFIGYKHPELCMTLSVSEGYLNVHVMAARHIPVVSSSGSGAPDTYVKVWNENFIMGLGKG